MAVAMLIGCGSDSDAPQGGTVDEPGTAPAGISPAAPKVQPEIPTEPDSGIREMGPGMKPVDTEPVPVEPAEPEDVAEPEPPIKQKKPAEPVTDRVKADVGVGKAGRSLDEYEGVIVTPAKALFTVREKAVFQIQIPKAMQLYKGINGNNPKTHEEFMTQIIEANGIQLPELPRDDRYVYDPEKGELMVERRR
jgi:hypothetical protein